MKSLLAIVPLLMLTACVTPVARHFPELPVSLQTPCDQLEDAPATDKLSVVLTVVTKNHGIAQECSIKVDAWRAWYDEQKKIFDSVK